MPSRRPGRPTNGTSSASTGSSHPAWVRIAAFLSLKAAKTQETYLGVLREWSAFLGAEYGTSAAGDRILKAQDLHALAFRAWLQQRPGERPRSERRESSSRALTTRTQRSLQKHSGLEATLSNATIAKKFAVLHRIYRMLLGANLGVGHNPFDPDRAPAPPRHSGKKRPTEMVDFKLVKKILALPDTRTLKGLRDLAVLSALFGGALRRGEAAALRLGDVRKTRHGTVYLYLRSTKARRDAEQALPRWAAEPIVKLAAAMARAGAKDSDFLFTSFTGQAGKTPAKGGVSSSGIYDLFKRYCAQAGAGKTVSPHSARATAITRLLAEGIPHREVQEFSRHKSVQMVELYDKRRIGVDENAAKDLEY
jgi:integrase/recombinase XerD